MSLINSVNRLPIEKYKCSSCDIELEVSDIRSTWKCPNCKDYISIYGEDKDTNTRITLERKKASELTSMDRIHLPGGLTSDSYQVLGINKLKNNKLGIGLEGYGQWKVDPDETINCRTGSW